MAYIDKAYDQKLSDHLIDNLRLLGDILLYPVQTVFLINQNLSSPIPPCFKFSNRTISASQSKIE